jgi:hypothetical protein
MRSQLSGVLTIDKPAGQSSAKTVAVVKKLLGVAKVGHSGTLDPFATGVLVCCVNQATRLARFFFCAAGKAIQRYYGWVSKPTPRTPPDKLWRQAAYRNCNPIGLSIFSNSLKGR